MADYTRMEQFLSGILNDTDVPDPYTREEKLLYAISKKGGGGGEASNVALFSVQMAEQNKFRTVETAGQIKAMVDSGKALIGILNVAEGMTAQLGVAYADFAGVSGPTNTLMLYSYDGGSNSLVPITLTASTENEVFAN